MFIELVDLLRCPAPHEDTWLVATVERMDDRFIIDGVLGCPICLAEYPIRGGVVFFDAAAPLPATGIDGTIDNAIRLAAALSLTEPRTVAVLQGRWTAEAPLIRSLSPSRLIALNPVSAAALADGVSAIVAPVAPLAASSVGAIALDEYATAAEIDGLVRALQPIGRAIGPISMPVPDGLAELARDADVWVAERLGNTPKLVSIGRRTG